MVLVAYSSTIWNSFIGCRGAPSTALAIFHYLPALVRALSRQVQQAGRRSILHCVSAVELLYHLEGQPLYETHFLGSSDKVGYLDPSNYTILL
ncbi:hypothetical protein BDY24DRAFT_444347 [Mrakia frigida]|uniref:uncharacterized protein n=1 Tax=Mrakia frigida TaxID=29902 RepID=UPI003FCC268E